MTDPVFYDDRSGRSILSLSFAKRLNALHDALIVLAQKQCPDRQCDHPDSECLWAVCFGVGVQADDGRGEMLYELPDGSVVSDGMGYQRTSGGFRAILDPDVFVPDKDGEWNMQALSGALMDAPWHYGPSEYVVADHDEEEAR
jgi:hypothetical protein